MRTGAIPAGLGPGKSQSRVAAVKFKSRDLFTGLVTPGPSPRAGLRPYVRGTQPKSSPAVAPVAWTPGGRGTRATPDTYDVLASESGIGATSDSARSLDADFDVDGKDSK